MRARRGGHTAAALLAHGADHAAPAAPVRPLRRSPYARAVALPRGAAPCLPSERTRTRPTRLLTWPDRLQHTAKRLTRHARVRAPAPASGPREPRAARAAPGDQVGLHAGALQRAEGLQRALRLPRLRRAPARSCARNPTGQPLRYGAHAQRMRALHRALCSAPARMHAFGTSQAGTFALRCAAARAHVPRHDVPGAGAVVEAGMS